MSLRIVSLLLILLLGACAKAPDRLVYTDVMSTSVDREMAYGVWAPADLGPDERLPLVVFLHGGGDDERCFDEFGVGQYLDGALVAGEIPRAVVVVPDGGLGFWENWHDGSQRFRDWVVDEVMPAVQTRFHTLPCPAGCHVAGTSMGGHGAIRFGLFEGERFDSVAALSGLILGTDDVLAFSESWFARIIVPMERIWGPTTDRATIERDDPFLRWRSQEDLGGTRLMVAWAEGDDDRILESNRAFHEHLVASRIAHAQKVFEGGHNWVSWTPVLGDVLRFSIWGAMDATGPIVSERRDAMLDSPGSR